MRLTCYYLADPRPRDETVHSLVSQLGEGVPIEVVGVDGSWQRAAVRCADAGTPYVLVITDHVALAPGAVWKLLRALRLRRTVRRKLYKITARVRCPLTENAFPGAVALYTAEAVSRIGYVDVPTAPMPSECRASIFGYEAIEYAEPVGWVLDDEPRSIYHRWFWARIRYRLGLFTFPVPTVTEHCHLYSRCRNRAHLYAAAGIADADSLRPKVAVVDDHYLGRLGRCLRFEPAADEPVICQVLGIPSAPEAHEPARRRAA